MTREKKRGAERIKKIRPMAKARWGYLLVLLASVSFVFCFGGTVPYTVFYLCILVPAVFLFMAAAASVQLRYKQTVDKSGIIKGGSVEYSVEVRNYGMMPVPLAELLWEGNSPLLEAQSWEISLAPSQKCTIEKSISFPYRGVYHFGMSHVKTQDFLGLFQFTRKYKKTLDVTVYPRLVPIRSLKLLDRMKTPLGRRVTQRHEEMSSDTRKYQGGDPLSRIHWNQTAQKGELTSKMYEGEDQWDVLCLLDTVAVNCPDEDRVRVEDWMIELTLAAVSYMSKRGNGRVRLAFCIGDTVVVFGRADGFDAIYKATAGLRFEAKLDLTEQAASLRDVQGMMLVTSRGPDEALKAVPAGITAQIFCVFPDEKEKKCEGAGNVRVYTACPDDDISVLLEKS